MIMKSIYADDPIIYEGDRSLLRLTTIGDVPSRRREAGEFI